MQKLCVLFVLVLMVFISADEAAAMGLPSRSSVAVTVVCTKGGHQVDSSFAGFSYEKEILALGTFDATNAAQVTLFKRLGPGIVRIGANGADETAWDAGGKGLSLPFIAPPDVDRLAGFLRACNWRAIYAVRFVNNTPDKAAGEAAYVAKVLGDRLLAFEIGNEPDHYCYLAKEAYHRHFIGPVDSEGGRFRPKNYGCRDFYGEWTTFADAIARSVPQASFVGPSCGGGGVNKAGNDDGWAKTFAELGGRRLAFLTTHYYIGDGNNLELGNVRYMLQFPEARLANVLDRMGTWSGAYGVGGGFVLDEANSYYGGGKAGLSDTYVSALWTVKFLFACAQNDACRGVNLHGGGHGLYTPIVYQSSAAKRERRGTATSRLSTAIEEIRPEYYGLSLFDLAVGGRIQATKIDGTNSAGALAAYAVAGDDGSTRVVLVNASEVTAFDATVDLGAPFKEAELVRLTGAIQGNVRKITLGGAIIGTDGTWNPTKECPLPIAGGHVVVSVPPFSAVLLKAYRS